MSRKERNAAKGNGARDRRRGVAAAELAILLPFVALLFGVTLDFCRIFFVSQTVQNCAEAGVLYASGAADSRDDVPLPEDAAADAAVAEGASLNPPLATSNVTTTFDGNGNTTVTVRYDFKLLTPFMGTGKTITITRSVTMMVSP